MVSSKAGVMLLASQRLAGTAVCRQIAQTGDSGHLEACTPQISDIGLRCSKSRGIIRRPHHLERQPRLFRRHVRHDTTETRALCATPQCWWKPAEAVIGWRRP
jgi:hypothetical protein